MSFDKSPYFRPNLFYSQKVDEKMFPVHEKKQPPIFALPPSSLFLHVRKKKRKERKKQKRNTQRNICNTSTSLQFSAGSQRKQIFQPKSRQFDSSLLACRTLRNSTQENYNQCQQINSAATQENMQIMFVINHFF